MLRLLVSSGLCLTGVIYGGVLGAAGTMAVNVLTNIVANDLAAKWDEIEGWLQGEDALLRNHDLTKAVGLAIAAVIAQTAKDETKIDRVYRSSIQGLAKYAANHWVDCVQQDRAQWQGIAIAPWEEQQLVRFFSGQSAAFTQIRVFSEDPGEDRRLWRETVVDRLVRNHRDLTNLLQSEAEAREIGSILDHLAVALSDSFPKALREVLKEDFEQGGRAFAGFTLDLLADIQQELQGIRATVNPGNGADLTVDFAEINQFLTDLRAEDRGAFLALGNRIESGFANVKDLLAEVGVKLDQLLDITTGIQSELREEFAKLDKKIAPPLPRLNQEDASVSIQYWQGRAAELADLNRWIAEGVVLIGIQGVGGVGKSTLAAKIYDGFPADRRFWADLRSPLSSFSLLARRVLQQLGGYAPEQVDGIPEQNFPNVLVRLLQQHHLLLVLDNLESVLDEAGNWRSGQAFYEEFFYLWLQSGQNSHLLLTAREQPDLPAINPTFRRFTNKKNN